MCVVVVDFSCSFPQSGGGQQTVHGWELQTNDALDRFHNSGQVLLLSGRTAGVPHCGTVCHDSSFRSGASTF